MAGDLYKEKLMERYHHLLFQVAIGSPTNEAEAVNSLCGDRLRFQLIVDGEVVSHIGWSGEGCAVSLVAADLLAEHAAGKSLSEIKSLTVAQMIALLGVEVKPSRVKCATLGLEALQGAISTKV